jgi:DNA-directed RNA polymerase specialized sigma24 family protein
VTKQSMAVDAGLHIATPPILAAPLDGATGIQASDARIDDLAGAILGMSATEMTALQLYFVDDFKWLEIATAMSIPLSDVHRLIQSIVGKLGYHIIP